jgi:hypothetical protein
MTHEFADLRAKGDLLANLISHKADSVEQRIVLPGDAGRRSLDFKQLKPEW